MKYLKLSLRPTGRAVHPVDEFIRSHDSVTREAILHVDSRPDTMTVLYHLAGDREAFVESLEANDDVEDHEVVAVDDGGFHVFIHAATDGGSQLLDIAHRHALIIDTPLEFGPNGLVVTLVGTHENLRAALNEMPDDITVTVENAGPYAPEGRDALSPLTDRQLEVFRTAVDEGYYDVPRRATHQDIAENLGCAPSTVDEHLRKAESRVVSAIVE